MAWSKDGFRPIRARIIHMLFYKSIYLIKVKNNILSINFITL
jgi:hypothetical protein